MLPLQNHTELQELSSVVVFSATVTNNRSPAVQISALSDMSHHHYNLSTRVTRSVNHPLDDAQKVVASSSPYSSFAESVGRAWTKCC